MSEGDRSCVQGPPKHIHKHMQPLCQTQQQDSSTDISRSDLSSCLLTDATTLLYLHHHYRALISFQNSCIRSLLMRDSQQCFLTTCSTEWDSLSYLSFLFCPDWYCGCRKISFGHRVHTLQNLNKVGVGTSRQFNTPHNAFDLI